MEVDEFEFDVEDISPMAWRLLRVAAGYEQRTVEKEIGELMQAHISMLENNNRSLSRSRLLLLFELYTVELSATQVRMLVDHF